MDHISDNNLADRQLVENVLTGNSKAFAAIIKNTEGLVAQIVFKMIINAEDRKDIAQDIYLKVYKHLPGFRFQSKLSTWIGQIAYNTCFSYLEKKKLVFPDHAGQETAEDPLEKLSGQSVDVFNHETETFVFKRQQAGIVQAEIENLPPVYKTLISLYHNESLSYEEIAAITALPMGTIKNYLFRARKTLKDNLLLKYKREDI